MKTELIAHCGMNCSGCNPSGKSCAHLKKYCKKLTKKEIEYCYECNDFPCKQIQKLDDKYRKRFDMSTIDNLRYIEENGMKKFLQKQEKKYKCSKCGGVICVHNGKCYSCDTLT